MRIGVYVRVSTPNQMQKQTIEQQVDRLRVFLAERTKTWRTAISFGTTATAERICVGPAWIACGMPSAGMSSIGC